MADRAERRRMTLTEFLEWDDGSDTHYELIGGRVFAMSPPSDAHGRIAGELGYILRRQIRPPCQVVHQAGIALADDRATFFEADLAVTCAPHRKDVKTTIEPILIVEVLSPSTATHDRTAKLIEYTSLPSVQEVLLVSSESRHAMLHRRDGARWVAEHFIGQATIELRSIGCTIDLAEVYQGLEL